MRVTGAARGRPQAKSAKHARSIYDDRSPRARAFAPTAVPPARLAHLTGASGRGPRRRSVLVFYVTILFHHAMLLP